MKKTLTIATLILVAAFFASFELSAKAENIDTLYDASQGSFAQAAPWIPGYNATYPISAASQIMDKTVTSETSTGSSFFARSDSFAATAPLIPGYTAAYPELLVVVVQN